MNKKQKKRKHCIVCGKRIRTGYKYCKIHRNYVPEKVVKPKKNDLDLNFAIIVVFVMGTIVYLATKSILSVIITFGLYFFIYYLFKKRLNRRENENKGGILN